MSEQDLLFGGTLPPKDEIDYGYLKTKKTGGGVPDVWKLMNTISENVEMWWGSTPCDFCRAGENPEWDADYWDEWPQGPDGARVARPEKYGKLPSVLYDGETGMNYCEIHKALRQKS